MAPITLATAGPGRQTLGYTLKRKLITSPS